MWDAFCTHKHRPASVMAFGSFMSQRELSLCIPLTHPELGRVSQDVLPASYSQSYSTIP